jgi:NADH-quinone oxidoreductase subunit G
MPEIVAFVGKSVDSELSGNMIDICPVGALTSKPFRYSARTWELARRKSVSPHDGLGSNLVVQVKQNKVMRVLPLENEAGQRVLALRQGPLLLRGAEFGRAPDAADGEEERPVGGDGVAGGLDLLSLLEEKPIWRAGVSALHTRRAVSSPASSARQRTSACATAISPATASASGIPWLGMPVADLAKLDRVLVVGSFLRKDHPLIAQRLRQAAKRGTQVHVLHSVDDDWLMKIASRKIVRRRNCLRFGVFSEDFKSRKEFGDSSRQFRPAASAGRGAPCRGAGDWRESRIPWRGGNSVGGYLAGLPAKGGLPEAMKKKAVLLLNVEEGLDCAPIEGKQFVVNLTSFKSNLGDVLLPIAPFTETAGTFVSTEGRVQGFHAAVRPLGEARPAWKVLRVLGTMLGLPGFEYETVEQVRDACLGGKDVTVLSNEIVK